MLSKTLSIEEMAVLRSEIGKTLVSFEGSPLGPNDYYGAIRLNIQGVSIDISNFFEEADVSFEKGMGTEEVGTMHVRRSDGPMSFGDLVSGPEPKVVDVGLIIQGIEVVNDNIEIRLDDRVTNSFAFTQALILHLETGGLVIDRNIWFEVILGACITGDVRKCLRDTEKDWNRGAGKYRATVRREIIAL